MNYIYGITSKIMNCIDLYLRIVLATLVSTFREFCYTYLFVENPTKTLNFFENEKLQRCAGNFNSLATDYCQISVHQIFHEEEFFIS